MPVIKINTPQGNKLLKEEAIKAAKEKYSKDGLIVACPKCNAKVLIKPNYTSCPNCGANITLEFE